MFVLAPRQPFGDSFWRCQGQPVDDQPHAAHAPVFLDLLSGPRCLLAQAFQWAGWKVLTPIDLAINPVFDLTEPSVQQAIGLPSVHLCAAAIGCGTKTRIREAPLPGATRARPSP